MTGRILTGFSPSERRRLKRLAQSAPSPHRALVQLGRLVETGGRKPLADLAPRDVRILLQLLGGSAYLSDILIGHGDSWADTLLQAIHTEPKPLARHAADFGDFVRGEAPEKFHARLRRHKRREFLRIGARDLGSLASVEETMGEVTALADFALQAAYRFCRADLERQHGRLLVPGTSRDNRFVILGVGKLGGKELNFSSDIDLIYLYETDEPANRRAIPPPEFFSQLAERLTDAMGKITEDGLVAAPRPPVPGASRSCGTSCRL